MVNLDYLYNPAATKKVFERNYFIDKKLGFSVIENGTILPHKSVVIPGRWHWGLGGIVDSNGEYIQKSSLHNPVGGAYTPETIQHSSETVVYLGLFFPVWGHDLTDNIRRIWFLKSDIFKSEFKNSPLVYIPYRDGYYTLDRQPDFKRLLEILEVDIDRLQPITQPTQFERIILADESFISPHNPGTGFTAEYRETIEQVRHFALKNRTPTSGKKLYFLHGKKQRGEERLAEYLKSKGYDIITPEQRADFDEELNLLINCDSFIAPIGSCSHNSLFLRDEAEAVFIPRAIIRRTDSYQEMLNQVHPLNVTYVDASLSIFSNSTATGPYSFIISEQLKRFFGDKFDGYEDEDFKNFLQYVKDSTQSGRTLIPVAAAYYRGIFPDFMAQLKRHEDLIKSYNMPPHWERLQPLLSYQTYVDKNGWGAWNSEEQISNPLDQKLDIQAIKINFPNRNVYYSVYCSDTESWSDEVSNSEQAGTTGESKSITGVKIRLDEAGAKEFDILYRMHKIDGDWTPWAKNGAELLSGGVKLNAIQVKLQPLLNYQTHLHNKGWRDGWHTENQFSNPLEQMLDVLAISLRFPEHRVYYSVYFNDTEGWSEEVLGPEMAGTTGIRKPIYGMRIRFDEAGAREFDILYRMHKFDDTWTPWAKNGEALYSHGVKLNAIQVKLRPLLSYQTHLHMKGWRDGWHVENQVSNPLAQKLDVLAIMINFPNHNVYYSVYFSDAEGWSKEVSNSERAGTVGKRKPIYGMKIRLDDNDAEEFDILYRMHKFDDTWTPWAKNGEELLSGGVKLNAVQIKLEPKT